MKLDLILPREEMHEIHIFVMNNFIDMKYEIVFNYKYL